MKKLNKIKKYTNILLMLTFIFTICSCEKFLEQNPKGNLTSETELSTVDEGEALVIGCYAALKGWTGAAGGAHNELPNIIEYWSGKSYTTVGHPQYWRWETDQVYGGLEHDFNNYWDHQYRGILNCNTTIEILPQVKEMSENQLSKALGEVRTLRAFYYFNLVRYFGDVIMITESINDPDKFEQPRTSLKTIYDEVIIPDLEYAVNESGLEDTRSIGPVTLHVARAILADVYLTCAGYPYQEVATNPTKNWCKEGLWTQDEYPVNLQSAISFLKKAQEQLNALYGQYWLGTYDDLHNPDMDFKGEAIFQISFIGEISDMDNFIRATLPIGTRISMYSEESGTNIPTMGYYNSYHPSDLRKQERQFFFTYDFLATRWDPNHPRIDFNQPYIYKYYDEKAIKETQNSDLNWTFYRYADILLMLTEVNWTLRELGGLSVSDNDIIKGINEVRERATLPSFSVGTLTLKDIMAERAYELILENKMTWDMRRSRRALVCGNGKFSELESFFGHSPERFIYRFGPQHLLAPIGNKEIERNRNCLQNFGYQPTQSGYQPTQ